MTKAVIFDMGGTLLHFKRQGAGTWREFETPGMRGVYQYLLEQGHELQVDEDTFVAAMFDRLSEGWEQATGGHLNVHLHDLIAATAHDHILTLDEAAIIAAAQRYGLPLRDGVQAAPGAIETLQAIRERGFRIGLVSNTIWPGEMHLEDLAQMGILPYLEHTIFSGDAGMWKPQPQVFAHMLDALGVAAQHAVFVGDSPREDIAGAQSVGMRAVWVRNQDFPPGGVQPDWIINELPDVLLPLSRWFAAE